MKPRLPLLAAVILLALSLLTLLAKSRIEQTVRVQAGTVLLATLRASVADVQVWADASRTAVEAAVRDERVRSALEACRSARSCEELGAALEPFARATGLSHVLVLDMNGEPLAHAPRRAARDQGKLGRALLHELEQLAARKAPAREVAFRPHGATLLLVAALQRDDGERAATLIAQRPFAALSAKMEEMRLGNTGETYVFDTRGTMLTASRFLREGRHGRTVELRVPGSGELTRAVSATLAGEAGIDVLGYLDYRGVPVIGAWRLLPQLQLGIVTEIDTADAYRTLQTLSSLTIVFALGLVAMLFVSLALLHSARRLRQQALQRAERFGQYHVERKLGEGGMGAVYLASHALLKRKAAIKLLREGRGSPEGLAAFEREVQITSTLTHPNTVSVYDYGRTDDGRFYYVMEYLDGLDLQHLVELFGPLPQARVLHFMRQLCGSLAEAHAAGIVHRDIKPANLIACTRGGVADALKVLDFGIARVAQQGDDGVARGTPEYMAPELFESNANSSPQSDLYSVGLVAYFLLTGAPPFSGGTTTEICHAHLTRAPEALATVLGQPCDAVLDAVIAACLKKHPIARPSSAAGLAAMLERSALARAWSTTDAEAWWRTHRDALDAHRASAVPKRGPESDRRSVVVGKSWTL